MTGTMGVPLEDGAQKSSSNNVLGGLPGGGHSSCGARLPQEGPRCRARGWGAEGRLGIARHLLFCMLPRMPGGSPSPQRPPHWGLAGQMPGGRP